jgi:hypothetical protein
MRTCDITKCSIRKAMTVLALQQHTLVFFCRGVKDCVQSAGGTDRGQAMNELVERIVAKVGVDRAVAEKSVGIILAFLINEGPADKMQALMDRLPGAEAAAKAAANGSGGIGGLVSGVMGGGIMGVGTKLMAAGLGMGQMQTVTREIIGFAREKAGEDVVGEIVGAIPGLGQFV